MDHISGGIFLGTAFFLQNSLDVDTYLTGQLCFKHRIRQDGNTGMKVHPDEDLSLKFRSTLQLGPLAEVLSREMSPGPVLHRRTDDSRQGRFQSHLAAEAEFPLRLKANQNTDHRTELKSPQLPAVDLQLAAGLCLHRCCCFQLEINVLSEKGYIII